MTSIGGYVVDVELSVSPIVSNEITEHPVESGADIADNVRVLPLRLTLEAVVTNTPLAAMRQIREALVTVDGETFMSPTDEADAFLRALSKKREPVTVSCSRGVFDRMVLESYAPQSSTYDELRFTATFKQINLVTNDRTTIRVEARPKKKKLGHRAPRSTPSIEAPDPNPTTRAAVSAIPENLKP